jgi:hypothetical protein
MTLFDRRALLLGLGGVALGSARAVPQVARARSDPAAADEPNVSEAVRPSGIATLPFERVTVAGTDAFEAWKRLRTAGRGWPVVAGNDEGLASLAEQYGIAERETPSVSAILAAAARLRFPDDLKRWPGAYQPADLNAPVGRWPDRVAPAQARPSVAADPVSGSSYAQVHILLIPTRSSWEVPAYLRWGGWNACPPPEYHVAALRSWHDRYGAELVGINGDTMNIRAPHRPGRRGEALALAREQYRYCPDIVDQGVSTLSALAAVLMTDPWWYLWWD